MLVKFTYDEQLTLFFFAGANHLIPSVILQQITAFYDIALFTFGVQIGVYVSVCTVTAKEVAAEKDFGLCVVCDKIPGGVRVRDRKKP